MIENHLTGEQLELYLAGESSGNARAPLSRHLANCALCQKRVAHTQRLELLLSNLPREKATGGLSSRIMAAVEWRVGEEQARSARAPWIAFATLISLVMTVWFGLQMLIALQDDGALDFFSLYASNPDLLSTYSADALFALVESLPISELLLTSFAVLVVIVLAQQWVDALGARVVFHGKTK